MHEVSSALLPSISTPPPQAAATETSTAALTLTTPPTPVLPAAIATAYGAVSSDFNSPDSSLNTLAATGTMWRNPSMKTSSLLTRHLRSIPNQAHYVPSHHHQAAAHSLSESILFLNSMSLTRPNAFLYSLADYY